MDTSFIDLYKTQWSFDIKDADVTRVKRFVKAADGKAIDLYASAETGNFSNVYESRETFIKVCFFLLMPDVLKEFNLASYDEAHAAEYQLFPELAKESNAQKALNWFTERIDGNTVQTMTGALEEALINFIPSQRIREAVRTLMPKTKAFQKAAVDQAVMKSEMALTHAEQSLTTVESLE